MDKQIQLFMLPFAGGNSLSFMKLMRFLDKRIEVVPVEYAGRGSRSTEKLIGQYNDFLEDVVSYIETKRNKKFPYAIFGYSMGSAVSFDIVSRNMLNENPIYSFFCAEGSLLYDNPSRKFAELSDDDFLNCISRLGGLDDRVLNNPSVRDDYLKLIKTDYSILGQYRYNSLQAPNDASILYSTYDKTCVRMEDWNVLVKGKTDFYCVGDDHFFIKKQYKEVADVINDKLSAFL